MSAADRCRRSVSFQYQIHAVSTAAQICTTALCDIGFFSIGIVFVS